MTQYEDSDPLEGMTPEQLEQLIQLGVIPEEQAMLAGSLSQARALRNKEGPKGTDMGRVYVAASPLEHAVHAYEGYKAGNDIKDLTKKQQDTLKRQTEGRMAFVDALRRKSKPTLELPEPGMGEY